MGIFLGWIVFSILVGYVASRKGRSGVLYFFLSIIISPLLGILLVLALGENKEAIENARLASGSEVKCHFCAELIKREAKVCKHCGKDSHPVYHGPWLRITAFHPNSSLESAGAKIGDAILKYRGAELNGDAAALVRLVETEGGAAVVTLVRDGRELAVDVPPGKLGVTTKHENIPDVTAAFG